MGVSKAVISAVGDGVRVAVRVSPKASRAGVAGIGLDAAGRSFLKVRVTAPAEGGKANAALCKLLAKAWRRPASSLSVVAGAKDRNKIIHVAGDPPDLIEHLNEWIETHHD